MYAVSSSGLFYFNSVVGVFISLRWFGLLPHPQCFLP